MVWSSQARAQLRWAKNDQFLRKRAAARRWQIAAAWAVPVLVVLWEVARHGALW
jgi:hypothetical protein